MHGFRLVAALLLSFGSQSLLAAPDDGVAMVDSLGGRTTRNPSGDIIGVDLRRTWVTDTDLARLAALPALESINLSYTKVTDLGLEELAPLKSVKVLDLRYAEYISDLGLAHLKHWRNLETLDVRGTKV